MLSLLVIAALVALTAVTGAQFEPGQWYTTIAKPAWTPPSWVFPPVWGALYVAIAFAGWLAWRKERRVTSPLMLAWLGQLVMNAAWSWLFFGLHRLTLALVDIVLLLGLILTFIVLAWPRSRPAAILFLPYLVWVGFAAALNARIVQLN